MTDQGLEPPEVWTREYVRTELWANVYGEPLPLDADPEPGDVPLETCPLTEWLAEYADHNVYSERAFRALARGPFDSLDCGVLPMDRKFMAVCGVAE